MACLKVGDVVQLREGHFPYTKRRVGVVVDVVGDLLQILREGNIYPDLWAPRYWVKVPSHTVPHGKCCCSYHGMENHPCPCCWSHGNV